MEESDEQPAKSTALSQSENYE